MTLDADGVLDRDTADRLLTAAYGKFGSYASNHNTTPDGVSDIFLNGTDDTMYKDVTADIDRNTTVLKTVLLIVFLSQTLTSQKSFRLVRRPSR